MTSYLIKSVVCSGILIIVYHLILECEKMPLFNRCYLLLAIIFSLTIPLLSLPVKQDIVPVYLAPAMPRLMEGMDNTALSDQPIITAEKNSPADMISYIPYIFYIVSSLLLLRFAINIRSVLKLKNRCRNIPMRNVNLVLVPQDIITYTFLNNIYLPEKSFEHGEVRNEILVHELAHARQMHSLDILFVELLHSFMWFNPFLFFYRRAIRLNHEFLADEAVLKEFSDVKSYQLLLLDTILEIKGGSLTSSFNYSITKKRLAMMTRIKNFKRHCFKQMVTGLLAFVLTFLFSEKIYSQIETGADHVTKSLPDISAIDLTNAFVKQKAVKDGSAKSAGPGITETEIDEFCTIIENHTTYLTNKKGLIDPVVTMNLQTKERVHALYTQMNRHQQQTVRGAGIVVFQSSIPVKEAPTREMFEKWKKPDVFGIWINEKHVPNADLEKYKNTDIAEYSLSKLYGAALTGRTYKYQLDLTTNDYFDKTYQNRISDRIYVDRARLLTKKPENLRDKFQKKEGEPQ